MPGRKVSEATRERETYEYESILIANSIKNDVQNLIPSSTLRSCSDSALTALAQVAVLRLNATRGLISLFDCQLQHIIAEATPALPISAGSLMNPGPDDLWLCGTAIPRSFGVCEHVLAPAEIDSTSPPPPADQDHDHDHVPVTIIHDLAEHAAFRERSYCQAWPHNRFYAGVPIRSHRGINIGVFCVFDDKPRDGLDVASVHLMQDTSAAILRHLELRRSGDGRRPGARMVRGLGSYVEGKTTMSGWQQSVSRPSDTNDAPHEGSFNKTQQEILRREDELASDVFLDTTEPRSTTASRKPPADPSANVQPDEPAVSTGAIERLPDPALLPEETRQIRLERLFSRAANILRESVEVEGVLFLDASIGSFAGSAVMQHGPLAKRRADSSSSSGYGEVASLSQAARDDTGSGQATCDVLGFSTSNSSSIDNESPYASHLSVPEKFLRKLLRRYPNGKIFNYDNAGMIVKSDLSSEDATTSSHQDEPDRKQGDGQDPSQKFKPRISLDRESKTMLKLFPGARSVCFVPLRDLHRQRWFAGCFVYTTTPTRIFSLQGEFSYISAFLAVIMADMALIDGAITNAATTSLLSSLSHELRSPLHGIVLCTELLRDTSLDVFQGDTLRSLETCGRTLLDTINHLLDWTKINSFMKFKDDALPREPWRRGFGSAQKNSITDGMMPIVSHIDLDTLVEEVVECIHAGHTYQQQSVLRLHNPVSPDEMSGHPHTLLDSIDTAENMRAQGTKSRRMQGRRQGVVVAVEVDPAVDWAFEGQPGALRRIIMNLCGNALKYTNHGFVKVVAYQESPPEMGLTERVVCIEVVDSGLGIGDDFLRNSLFAPFAQEDAHDPGAGLGLSLVRKFVKSLNGSIRVQSKKGAGTKVSVKLPLQVSSLKSTDTTASCDEFDAQVIELSRLRVIVAGFSTNQRGSQVNARDFDDLDEEALMQNLCQKWLQMHVVGNNEEEDFLPDLVLCNQSYFDTLESRSRTELSTPVIVICFSAAVALELERSHRLAYKLSRGLFSFISRPVGPRKLAKAFVLCFRRWAKLQATATDRSSISTMLDVLPSVVEEQPAPKAPSEDGSGYFDIAQNHAPDNQPVRHVGEDARTPMPLTPSKKASVLFDQARILLVEDNPINMKILQTYMNKLGQVYDSATDGQQAVNYYREREGRYRCILMDISMPVMDGFQATQLIRGFERDQHLPRCHILAITGLASKDAQEEAFVMGLDLLLSKPVRLKELTSILKERGVI